MGHDVQFGNDLDNVRILQFYSAGPVKETSLRLGRMEPFGTVLAAVNESETWAGKFIGLHSIPLGEWITVEWIEQVLASDGGIAAVVNGKHAD